MFKSLLLLLTLLLVWASANGEITTVKKGLQECIFDPVYFKVIPNPSHANVRTATPFWNFELVKSGLYVFKFDPDNTKIILSWASSVVSTRPYVSQPSAQLYSQPTSTDSLYVSLTMNTRYELFPTASPTSGTDLKEITVQFSKGDTHTIAYISVEMELGDSWIETDFVDEQGYSRFAGRVLDEDDVDSQSFD